MSEPRRLADETPVSLERELLQAGIEDAPAPGAHERAAASLGIAAPVVAGTTTPGSVAPGAQTGVAGSVAVAKVVVIAALALTIGVFVAIRLVPLRSEPARVTPPVTATAVAAEPAPSIAPSVEPAPSEVATVASAESAPAPAFPGKVTTARPAASLGDEISLLDRARAALRDGDPATALRLVDAHDARFRGDTFALESSVLRIDALDALGRSAEALALADRFLAAHPNTPMSQHVRSIADRIRAQHAHP
jgi:hypothetical protein